MIDHHPEFPERITTKVAKAALLRLQADSALSAYCSGGIHGAELEDLYMQRGFSPPALALAINAQDIDHLSGGARDLTTVLELVLVQSIKSKRVEDEWLRSRIVDHIRVTIWGTESGMLRDEAGNDITIALTRFQRLLEPLIDANETEIRTRMRVAFRSVIDETMEFIP